MPSDADFMQRAIELARNGMEAGDGGPFGAVIVRDGGIIGEGWNRVLAEHDPTAHGEVRAIRDACSRTKDFRLTGCTIFTTGQPCPMCLGAIHWARISRIYYGFSIEDAGTAGFDDADFFSEFARPEAERSIPASPLLGDEARELITDYMRLPNRKDY